MTALAGLILVGGRNRRMGKKKPQMRIGPNHTEMREYLYELLSTFLGTCVFSINRQQKKDAYYRDKICVTDLIEDRGPMGGLLSAITEFPEYSFLAVACDMPNINTGLFQQLLHHRGGEGVFFELNSRIEPLCGIYENTMFDRIHKAFNNGEFSLQKMLNHAKIKRIALDSAVPLFNVNTPLDLNKLQGENHGQKIVV